MNWKLLIILLPFLIFACDSKNENDFNKQLSETILENEDTLIKTANELFENIGADTAIYVLNEGINKFGKTDKLIHNKYKILLISKNYEDALEVFDLIIQREGDGPDIIIDKIRLLTNLNRLDEALKLSLETDKKSEGSSQYISIYIAKLYHMKEDDQNSLNWLFTSFERGFNEFDYLLSEEFHLLHDSKEFKDLIDKMQIRAGIGSPIKTFRLKQYNGEEYSLKDDKGMVILIDFWATWCPPCVSELPHLNELYEKYKDQGFQIVSISADSKKESMDNFLMKNNIPWVNGFSANGRNDEIVKLYNIESYPTYIIVNRNGIINYITNFGGDKLTELIEKTIQE